MAVKTVALVWEQGSGFEHLAPLLSIGAALKRNGYRPVFILHDVAKMEATILAENFEYVQAPVWHYTYIAQHGPHINFTQTLFSVGYCDVQGLLAMVKAWLNLLLLIKPDILLFDYSPTALLASRALNIPRVLCGNAFSIPPQKSPLPAYFPRKKTAKYNEQMEAEEAQCVHVVNQVLTQLKLEKIQYTFEIYQSDYSFITSGPAMDIYESRQEGKYLGIISTDNLGSKNIVWPEVGDKKIFVYVRSSYNCLDVLLEQLLKTSARYVVYGVDRKRKQQFAGENIYYTDTFVNISAIREECDAAVIHGGNLIEKFSEVGKPLLLLPMTVENLMMANKLQKNGTGLVYRTSQRIEQLQLYLKQLVSNKQLLQATASFSEKMLGYSHDKQLQSIVNKVDELTNK